MHVHRFTRNHLGRDHAFVLGFVREHGTRNAIADRVDVREVGAHLVVDEYFAALAELESERRGVDPCGDRTTADRDEHIVAVDALRLSVFLHVDEYAGVGEAAASDARAGANVESLLAKDALRFFHDVVVHAGQNRRQQLDDGDLGAESFPDGSELEADDAAADDDEVGGDARDSERADVGENAVFVEFEEGELDWYGAGGNDDVFCLVRGDCLLGGAPRRAAARDLDHIPRAQRPAPLRPRDLVLPKEEFYSPRVLTHDIDLPLRASCRDRASAGRSRCRAPRPRVEQTHNARMTPAAPWMEYSRH
jgi:hypothetical protein